MNVSCKLSSKISILATFFVSSDFIVSSAFFFSFFFVSVFLVSVLLSVDSDLKSIDLAFENSSFVIAPSL